MELKGNVAGWWQGDLEAVICTIARRAYVMVDFSVCIPVFRTWARFIDRVAIFRRGGDLSRSVTIYRRIDHSPDFLEPASKNRRIKVPSGYCPIFGNLGGKSPDPSKKGRVVSAWRPLILL